MVGNERSGEFAHRLSELERDMEEKVLGDCATTLRSRVNVLEEDKKTRTAANAAIATTLGAVVSVVVWVMGSGVIERVDALRQDLRVMQRAPRPEVVK